MPLIYQVEMILPHTPTVMDETQHLSWFLNTNVVWVVEKSLCGIIVYTFPLQRPLELNFYEV